MFQIKTDRLFIRPRSASDADFYADLFSNPKVLEYGIAPAFRDVTRQELLDACVEQSGRAFQRERGLLGTATLHDGTPIAVINMPLKRPHGPELLLYIAPQFHAQRFGTEIIKASLVAFRDTFNVQSVAATIHPDNKPSMKLALNAGFQKTGAASVGGWHMCLLRKHL